MVRELQEEMLEGNIKFVGGLRTKVLAKLAVEIGRRGKGVFYYKI